MKANSLIVITLLAVLALTPLTPPVHGGTAGGPATVSVGAGQTPVGPAAPVAHFPPNVGGDREGVGEGPGVRASPGMFIQNVGQFADGARFQVRGGDKTIWLAEDGVWVTVVEGPHPTPGLPDGRHPSPLSAAERGEGCLPSGRRGVG